MNTEIKIQKTKHMVITVFVFLLLIFIINVKVLSAQNQDCPNCPSNNDQQKNTVQGEKKVVMVGNVKVTILPSKYTQEFLEKTFPVPEEWKEWYKLQENGKLPANIKIVDYSFEDAAKFYKERTELEFNPDLLADLLLDTKKRCNEISDKSIIEFKKKIKDNPDWGCAGWEIDVSFRELNCYQIIPLHIECYNSSKEVSNTTFLQVFQRAISSYKGHPVFFKNELLEMKKYTSYIWTLYNNSLNKKQEGITNVRWSTLSILYFLESDINKVISKCKKNPDNVLLQDYEIRYYDPVNKKTIFYIDPRLKEFYDWILSNGTSFDKAIAFNYFKMLGDESYIDKMVDFCKLSLDRYGIEVFQFLLDKKDDPRVINLAKYYFNNMDKINFRSSVQKDLIYSQLKNYFGLARSKKK